MKTFLLIFIFSIFNSSCFKSQNFQIEPPNSPPILEMSEELYGNWDITGKMLDFRLYENGLAEFDTLNSNKKVSGKINRIEDIKEKKQIQVSMPEVQQLLNLLNSNEFSNLQISYQAKRGCIDNNITNVIRFRYENKDKTIEVSRHCENLANPNSNNFPNFPPVLSNLYKLIGEIKRSVFQTK